MKSVLLIGLGRFGKHIATKLNELDHQVMGIDDDEERVNDAIDILTSANIGDSTNEDFLRTLGVGNYDLCIVAIGGNFQSSLETTSLLKELGAKFVVSRAEQDIQEKFLLRNGADRVVYPEKQVARWTAIRYSSDYIINYMELDKTHSIFEVTIPDFWIGKSIGEIDIRKKYGINIIALKDGEKTNLMVKPTTILEKNLSMLVIGEDEDLQKCFHM